ncbi:MAG: SusD/RagB family nutrient-binding outer membrane lipoprotein [Bacteroidetes bacterium]|nr:MAG: SusD/RagB family nutrient-binding outer membrane lipoprotein [Bacteroidota bacterium]
MATAACSPGDFGDINVNPNALETPIPEALLTYALISTAGSTQDMICGMYCQYFSQSSYTDLSRYSLYDRSWSGRYSGSLYDLQLIIDLNSDPNRAAEFIQYGSNANQIAVARILMAYGYANLTDQYGDIPYSEALKLKPQIPYDLQEDVYRGILNTLKESVGQFDGGPGPTGDILFDGDITKWKKFANSLRLTLALRLSNVAPDLAKAEFLDVLQDPAGIIESNADNAEQSYVGGLYRNPWFSLYDYYNSYGISQPLVAILESLDDPRLYVFGQPNSQNKVIGLPYGVERDSVVAFTNAYPDWSYILQVFKRSSTSPVYILTASNVLLARAEAAQLGWTNEDPAALYRAGILASFEQWGVFDANSFANYMLSDPVSMSSNALEKIRLQRYLSHYPDGLQAYNEWRRTGVPDLQPTPYALNASKQIPRRFKYPDSEQTLNGDAWQIAVDRMGGTDSPDNRVWWDK